MKIRMVTVGSLSALIAASPAYAADVDANWHHGGTLPAVSRTNFKLGLSGGFVDLDNEDSGGRVQLEGSYTTPLSHATGLQIDASIGAMSDDGTLRSLQERWGLVDDAPAGYGKDGGQDA